MNTALIKAKADLIEEMTTALNWLEKYGDTISATGEDDHISITVRIDFARSVDGCREVEKMMSSLARYAIPDLVEKATRNCRNTIDLCVEAISEEVAA